MFGVSVGFVPLVLLFVAGLLFLSDLVAQLALGAGPEVRRCPVCQHSAMRAATLCGYCWTKLTPPAGRDGVVG